MPYPVFPGITVGKIFTYRRNQQNRDAILKTKKYENSYNISIANNYTVRDMLQKLFTINDNSVPNATKRLEINNHFIDWVGDNSAAISRHFQKKVFSESFYDLIFQEISKIYIFKGKIFAEYVFDDQKFNIDSLYRLLYDSFVCPAIEFSNLELNPYKEICAAIELAYNAEDMDAKEKEEVLIYWLAAVAFCDNRVSDLRNTAENWIEGHGISADDAVFDWNIKYLAEGKNDYETAVEQLEKRYIFYKTDKIQSSKYRQMLSKVLKRYAEVKLKQGDRIMSQMLREHAERLSD